MVDLFTVIGGNVGLFMSIFPKLYVYKLVLNYCWIMYILVMLYFWLMYVYIDFGVSLDYIYKILINDDIYKCIKLYKKRLFN